MCGTSLLFYEWKWATQLNSVLLTNGDRLDVLAAAKDFTFSFLLRTMVPISVIIMNKGSNAREDLVQKRLSIICKGFTLGLHSLVDQSFTLRSKDHHRHRFIHKKFDECFGDFFIQRVFECSA